MKKKLIFVAAPPACGKTYVSELIAKSLENVVYLDKDDLCDLLRTSFTVCGKEIDMDGEFYINNLRSAEYSTILTIAFSTLRFARHVILSAPFGKEVRSTEYMRSLKDKANDLDAELLMIWVTAPLSLCYERMKKRNSDRDILKLENWEAYVKKTNYAPPYELEDAGAVDRFMIFDTASDEAVKLSLKETIKIILGE